MWCLGAHKLLSCSLQREGHLDLHAHRDCLALFGPRFEPPLLEGVDRSLIKAMHGIERTSPYCPGVRPNRLITLVIVEDAAEPRTPTNAPEEARRGYARDQHVLNPLVIPLPVIVLDVLRDRPTQMALPERDHTVQA